MIKPWNIYYTFSYCIKKKHSQKNLTAVKTCLLFACHKIKYCSFGAGNCTNRNLQWITHAYSAGNYHDSDYNSQKYLSFLPYT